MTTTTRTRRTAARLRTVAGIVAVAVACSSGAYAAGVAITSSSQIKKGVVNSGDIKNGTVKVKDLNKKTVAALDPTVEAWRTFDTPGNPQMLTFWHAFGDSYGLPGFRVDNDGVVHLRGAATQGANVASGSAIAVLPVGYRPAACEMFPIATFDGSGNAGSDGAVSVCPNGTVFMFKEGDDRFVSLNGISFSAS